MANMNRRQLMGAGLGAGVMMSLPAQSLWASRHRSALETINVGMISCGGRAGGLASQFDKIDGVNIAGLCDPDANRVEIMGHKYPKADRFSDLRDLLESSSIDAVVVATCNHWHCLAAIWAMEAGKHVYVEKPLSHSQWEGMQTVAAARKYNRTCQIGTQQRSDPMQKEIKDFLHRQQGIGKLTATRVNRIGRRGSIGKRDTPLEIEKNVAYDLWLGPAQDEPIYRDKLHYDWHWDWNTGSGEMGNWGVHILDDVRNNVFQDQVILPRRIAGGGGRISWNDAGETPNVHFAYFDTGVMPVVISLTNLADQPGGKKSPAHPGPGSGYIVYGEGGRLEGQRGRAVAFDSDGKKIKEFKGTSGSGQHQRNFTEAVQQEDASLLNAEIKIRNDSTGWCNLANIAFRAGAKLTETTNNPVDHPRWEEVLGFMGQHTAAHNVPLRGGELKMSKLLTIDPGTEKFVGAGADEANALLKREYRDGYVVPTLTEGPVQ